MLLRNTSANPFILHHRNIRLSRIVWKSKILFDWLPCFRDQNSPIKRPSMFFNVILRPCEERWKKKSRKSYSFSSSCSRLLTAPWNAVSLEPPTVMRILSSTVAPWSCWRRRWGDSSTRAIDGTTNTLSVRFGRFCFLNRTINTTTRVYALGFSAWVNRWWWVRKACWIDTKCLYSRRTLCKHTAKLRSQSMTTNGQIQSLLVD